MASSLACTGAEMFCGLCANHPQSAQGRMHKTPIQSRGSRSRCDNHLGSNPTLAAESSIALDGLAATDHW
jgi:hypothetical protein